MIKRIISCAAAAAMMFGAAAYLPEGFTGQSIIISDALTYGDYEYTVLSDGTVEINKYNGSDSEVLIPNEVDGKKVTKIGIQYDSNGRKVSGAFQGNQSITAVRIPDDVTSIDEYAFAACTNLEAVGMPENLTSLGSYAFAGCSSLCEVGIPDGIEAIPEGAFSFCVNLTGVFIPEGVKSIGKGAFSYCENLQIVSFSEGLKTIGEDAFTGCKQLEELEFCDGLESIGKNAFSFTALNSLKIPRSVTSIGENAVGYGYYDNDKVCKENVPEFVIICNPESVASMYAVDNGIEIELEDDDHKHTMSSEDTTPATCTVDGVRTFTCSVCNYSYTAPITAQGHDYADTVVEPTCTEKGYTLHKCKNCPYSYKDNEKNAKGHSYKSAVTKAATCTEQGVKTFTCACGDSYTEPITAKGHDCEETVVEPTCTEKGYTLHKCKNCPYSYKDNEKNAKGHSYKSAVTKAATCTEQGVKTFTCACGASYTEPIPAKGHDCEETVVEPTCTEKGYTLHKCKNCDYSYKDNETEATGHRFTNKTVAATYTAKGYTEHTCTVCKYSYKDNYTDMLKRGDISKATVTNLKPMTYTGAELKPKPKVVLGGKTLNSGRDYAVSYKNNKNAGTATVIITGRGDYTGTKQVTFKIQAVSIKKATVEVKDQVYSGKKIKAAVKVKLNKVVIDKANFIVTYKNNKNIGKATITIKGKKNLKGQTTVSFKILPATPKKLKLSAAGNGKVKVACSDVNKVDGIYIQYSLTSGFSAKDTKTVKVKKLPATLNGLKKGKTYYVRIKTFVNLDGKKVLSAYSAKGKIKV